MLESKIPPPIYALLCCALVVVSDLLFPLDWLSEAIRFVAVFFCLIGGAGLLLDSLMRFIKTKTTVNPLKPESASRLVVKGVFRYSRNPMYLGMLMLILALVAFTGNPLGILPSVLFVVVINKVQIAPEERALETIFGEEYRHYKTSVRRWI